MSILVENNTGVLCRISGLFSRRCYNIDSLSVGITEDPDISRITVVTSGDEDVIRQIRAQVEKLVDVRSAVVLDNSTSVGRELTLVKVATDSATREEIVNIAGIFRARIIDVTSSSLVIELTGTPGKIKAFLQLMEPFGILELVRTGLTAIQRGDIRAQYPRCADDLPFEMEDDVGDYEIGV